VQAGTKDNIIPDTAELGINLRTLSPTVRKTLRAAVERIVTAEAQCSGAPEMPEVDWFCEAPALVNDADAAAATVAAFLGCFGEQRVIPQPPIQASEDVGAFGTACGAPTFFWFWGGADPEVATTALREGRPELVAVNHSPHFAPVIEPTLSTGVQNLVVAALAWLVQQQPNHTEQNTQTEREAA
jgi:hippurate hydrolase